MFDERYYENAEQALRYLKAVAGNFQPKTAVVLGSGLGSVSDKVCDALVIDTKDIPHWPRSTAPGHAGQVVLGKIEGRPVVLLKGRVHYYEGYSLRKVTFPTRVLGIWGIEQHIGTNASGGIDIRLKPGDIVLIEDHINYMGNNPLIGATALKWNVHFPDMTHVYSPRLLALCEKSASLEGIHVERGVYIAFSGPSYETPAEIRMARILGASVVGMSTVPEAIVSNAMGMETAAISCVTNLAAGMSDEVLDEEAVLSVMRKSSDRMGSLICAVVKQLEGGNL
ncbi:MAG: purine-nucleoside phosphorylase [Synergistaceae bacterium]|jgi:purine-nucleoside phosphorylase|nr:purine-nucleoside phosphorylase [Synergistaceae bacterium]